jgi:hypothetical protein
MFQIKPVGFSIAHFTTPTTYWLNTISRLCNKDIASGKENLVCFNVFRFALIL